MTNLFPNPPVMTSGDGPGQPGGAPVGSTMQGNPQESQYQPQGVQPQGVINSAAAPLTTQVSNGQIPLQAQPTNVQHTNQTLHSLLATGQISLNISNYGQAGLQPATSSPSSVNQAGPAPQATGPASGVTLASPVTYGGQ